VPELGAQGKTLPQQNSKQQDCEARPTSNTDVFPFPQHAASMYASVQDPPHRCRRFYTALLRNLRCSADACNPSGH